jgi:tetratricopeptide (TPR) repeat protein
MLPRACCLVAWLCCVGCHTLTVEGPDPETATAAELWEKGQAAMRAGQPARAVGYYEQSLQADPAFTRNHLSLAAAHLENGDDEAACAHLGLYVADHPEHVLVRGQYAELLLKLKRVEAARGELARLVADEQDKGKEALNEMIHCHSRLVEIAEDQEDDYAAHLHRGIGLYLLAGQRAGLDDPDDELPVEGLLCRSASELALARMLRPHEARPYWYLYTVWSRLGQKDSARACLREAAAAAAFTDLTPAEQRSLMLACQAHETRR